MPIRLRRSHWLLLLLLAVFGLAASPVAAQCASARNDGLLVANPNRPTVSDPADITQLGVLEGEYGYDHMWEGSGQRMHDFGGMFKFGLLCDLELRWTNDLMQHMNSPGEGVTGSGDHWLGAQYRFHHQSARTPTLSFRYEVKIPTASAAKGLGSGKVDHAFTALASKDLGKFHVDFNAGYLLAGRPAGHAFDTNYNFALAFSHPLRGKWGITGEAYGESTLNLATPAYASTLWGVTYALTPRLVLDSGLDLGITRYAPQAHVFAGFTYAIADLYRPWRRGR